MPVNKNIRWFSRTVLGIGLASFFSDLGHETATAILPMFLASIGAAPAALGIIEGVSDAVASFSKLGSGWYSDRLEKKKPLAVTGYVLTGISKATFAFATSWIYVLAGRTLGWFGRGLRGPVRDTILTESVPPEARGRAFGFDRALDTLGAVIGPLAAMFLITFTSYRNIFLLTLIPGMLSACAFAFFVKEPKKIIGPSKSFILSVKDSPSSFRRYLLAVGIFGMSDFAHTLLILRATIVLAETEGAHAGQLAVSLYVIHNIIYAAASYPVGWLGDHLNKKIFLSLGYALFGVMCVGFMFSALTYGMLLCLFTVGGLYMAIQDSLERAIAADLLPSHIRGTGFGVLAAVNGIGDLVSSVAVGILWSSVSVAAGFMYSAILSLLGAVLMLVIVPGKHSSAHGRS